MALHQKKPANKNLDFVFGILGVIGLVIELVRMGENEINWGMFAGGFVVSFLLGILATAACSAIIFSAATTPY